MPHFDRDRFFGDLAARGGAVLTPQRRDAIDFLLGEIERDRSFTMLREIAYFLATIRWETAGTFLPIKEFRASQSKNPRLFQLQQAYWPSGFFGRGYVQLTFDHNYRKAGTKLANERFTIDGRELVVGPTTFLDSPDLLLDPTISYRIAARGMREGWFTGRRLAQFIVDGTPPDYVNARRIINGTDRAAEIAAIAEKFELLLRGCAVPTAPARTARKTARGARSMAPSAAPARPRRTSKRRGAKKTKRAPARRPKAKRTPAPRRPAAKRKTKRSTA